MIDEVKAWDYNRLRDQYFEFISSTIITITMVNFSFIFGTLILGFYINIYVLFTIWFLVQILVGLLFSKIVEKNHKFKTISICLIYSIIVSVFNILTLALFVAALCVDFCDSFSSIIMSLLLIPGAIMLFGGTLILSSILYLNNSLSK